VVSEDTLTTTERLDEMFDQARIRPGIKQNRVLELFESFVNVESLLKYVRD
jgi:BioD-like phosphotransacetylase family protein